MKKWMHQAEKAIDDFIPLVLLIFLVVVGMEIFFAHQILPIKGLLDWFDLGVLTLLAVDLFFKFQRARSWRKFLKQYWLQVLAIIPFFLVFRLLEYLELADLASKGSTFLNETRVAGRGPALIIREAQQTGSLSRTTQLLKFQPLARLPRLLAAIPFFERPTGSHHKGESKVSRKSAAKKGK